MNPSFYALTLLGLLLFACGPTAYPPEFADREADYDHPPTRNADYFDREEVTWSLVTPDQVPLYVLEAGQGERVVVLHGGFGMEHSYLRKALRPYEDRYRMIYYDQRGSMRSPIPENDYDQYITMDNMVNDLELLRRELGEEKLTLLAHSMGAVLAYEYLRRYPDRVGEMIVLSGFSPKLPDSPAEFHDMFQSQREREAFGNRPAVRQTQEALRQSMDTTTRAYRFLEWKVESVSCQIYDMNNWAAVAGSPGSFNGAINPLIGPESNLPWSYFWKFYTHQRRFDRGTLDAQDTRPVVQTPVNYLPVIEQHPYPIHYLLGRQEFGDFNLRMYERHLTGRENVEMHIFEEAGHNIWLDQPELFYRVLSHCLREATQVSAQPAAAAVTSN